MKVLILVALVVVTASSANAEAVKLKGKAADAFIAKYFPYAPIPGPLKGDFTYIDKKGEQATGLAECVVPAMGARSEGAVSICEVRY